jgi:dipeptidyl aminopeptidase/acylaminoacyl peptidase
MDTASDYYIGRLITFPLAALSCRGYLILRPNPRGSGGYGRDFRFATIGDWGGKDYDDDIGGVDYLISTGVADSDRLGVMGSSYGGYMTNWVITQTQRFKAAVVWAGISDLLSFELTTDEPSFVPDYFRSGSGQFRALEQHSPVTFASRVKTPTLIMHGEADTLVPPGQASESYHAIRFTGTESQMVLYPRTGHVPHEPKLILDIERRTIEWMDRHLR